MDAIKILKVSGIFFTFLLLINAKTTFSQFSMVSSYPTHGDINVDTAATFIITFSAPIDTTVRFAYPEGFYINLFIFPETFIGEPDSVTLSPDMQTMYVHNLHLYPGMIYLFVLVDAVNQSGDSLDRPYSMVFTTSSSLPVASVSGTLSYPGNDPSGAWVILFDDYPFKEDGGAITNGIVIPPPTNFYTVDYVLPGTYWPAAIKNFHIDENGDPMIELGSGVGFYDPDGDHIIDSIEVTTSSQITGIDFSLHTAVMQTARDPFPAVEVIAQAWTSDAVFAGLFAEEIEPDGNSLIWQYLYYSPSLTDHSVWLIVGDLIIRGVVVDSSLNTFEIHDNWLNSDIILGITEVNGGFDFRQNYPDAEILAYLSYPIFNDGYHRKLYLPKVFKSASITPQIFQTIFEEREDRTSRFASSTDVVLQLPAVWMVQYYSDSTGEVLLFIIDAVSGEILNAPITAAAAEQIALPLAQYWSTDVRLWGIFSQESGVGTLGTAGMWSCIYYSSMLDSLFAVILWGQIPVASGNPGWLPLDTLTIPSGWFDSDVCIAVAEANGGSDYRTSNPDATIDASLLRWFMGPKPDLTVWTFTYTSSTAPDLVIIVDAFSGLIVGVDESEENFYPEEFALYQNYPNPFNPSTKIRFTIPELRFTILKVYDVLGNEVATLVNEELPTGEYEVEFNVAANLRFALTSGVYFYRISATNFIDTKKMILLR